MLEIFLEEIKQIYRKILLGENITLHDFKKKWGVKTSIGEVYQSLSKRELKKELGSFYTPQEVVDFMVEDALNKLKLREKSYIKILDPSCGGGYFLTTAFESLVKLYKEQGLTDMEEHILTYNLYGFDIDENAVMLTTIEFFERTGRVFRNLKLKDFLMEEKDTYDLIIGNPPYMGHKVLTGDYREKLYELYGDVFKDKADLSYCFIKKSIDSLRDGGRLCFFTSRYLLEALNAKDIRRYMLDSGRMDFLLDFYGVRVVKGAGVDTVIFKFIKGELGGKIDFFRLNESAKGKSKRVFEDVISKGDVYSKYISTERSSLKEEGWSFLSETESSVLNKIRGTGLGVLCEGFQGIITGCDGAFVLSDEEARVDGVEKELLKPWIKSSNIHAFYVDEGEELLIYSDLIEKEENFKGAIGYIGKFKERLEMRRECVKGSRRWFDLQWGRKPELFEETKIVYPYKSKNNRFAIDSGNYFSADVYGIRLRDMFTGQYTYEYLTGLLNSSIYEFYIKSMAKKLGDDLYEYYPNKIMTLKIPDFINEVDEEVRLGGRDLRERVDRILVDKFGLTSEEYEAVLEWVK